MQLDLMKQLFRNKPQNMNEYRHNVPMQMWCEDDKPSTKMLLKGKMALSDAELLSIIIGNDCSRKRSSLDSARSILNKASDNLGEIATLSVVELLKAGITMAQATRVITAFEIGRRRNASEVVTKEKISTSRNAYEIFRSVLTDKPYEEFWIILLNRANKVIGKCQISEGGISGTVVDPKKIFKVALDHHASSLILGHNHPSNSTCPSEADQRITKKLVSAGLLLEITVLDHIILSNDGFYSFADDGMLEPLSHDK
jgi:DNA repair protein RadC